MNCKNCDKYVPQKRRDRATPFCGRRCYFAWRTGENHPMWVGNDVGYQGVHSWIKRKFGVPKVCENCGEKNRSKYEWANISGTYKRTRSDWTRLCVPCHIKMDNHREKQWKTIRESKRCVCVL